MRAACEFMIRVWWSFEDTVMKWAGSCDNRQFVAMTEPDYFTVQNQSACPEAIMTNPSAVGEIRSSDIWCFLTGGFIDCESVLQLAEFAAQQHMLNIPVVLLVVGEKLPTPAQTNISVVIPYFILATEGVLLFKDSMTGELFVVAAKGSLAPLARSADNASSVNLSSWESWSCYSNETELMRHCEELSLGVLSSEHRPTDEEVSLGSIDSSKTETVVSVNQLLSQCRIQHSDLTELLEEKAIIRLVLFCQSRNCLADLRRFLIQHRQPEIAVRVEDVNGVSKILEAMGRTNSTSECTQLRERLLNAHAQNLATYFGRTANPTEVHERMRMINMLIDRGLAVLSLVERFQYSAEVLERKSDRARRAVSVTTEDVDTLTSLLLNAEPVNAFRGSCSICCGEDKVMCIVLKKVEAAEENTTDFALDFPLAAAHAMRNIDMISSLCMCFQCALRCEKSVNAKTSRAIIPTLEYSGTNEEYVNHQLALAITGGLYTDISAIVQIFMTVLYRTLETKPWCSDQSGLEDNQKDFETSTRHNALKW